MNQQVILTTYICAHVNATCNLCNAGTCTCMFMAICRCTLQENHSGLQCVKLFCAWQITCKSMQHTSIVRMKLCRLARPSRSVFELTSASVFELTLMTSRSSTLCTMDYSSDYNPTLLRNHSPVDASHRYDYNKGLVVPRKCVLYTYTGSRNHLHFLGKIAPDQSVSELLQRNLLIQQDLKKKISTYHTACHEKRIHSQFRCCYTCKARIPA